jgi:uncharacterized protein YmfQ (DUF2313 family)
MFPSNERIVPVDQYDTMTQIRKLAIAADHAVSIVTVGDALNAAGVMTDEPTPEQVTRVISSWEWKHYGDN